MEVSIVVPVYNEAENLAELHGEIDGVCKESGYTYEIIFIDDGSTDGSHKLAKTLSPLKYIRLRKNFGQTAAMDAGIKAAKYPFIVTMDGDRQNDPRDIPMLLDHLVENDLDVVSGWRKHRKDTPMKRFMSRGANFLRGILVKDGIHDSGCSLKAYRSECFENVTLYGEMHRFIPALLKLKGFLIGEAVVNHRPRVAGRTKYNWKRTFKGFVDMVNLWFWNKYASRPLHLFGTLGLLFLLAGGAGVVVSVVLHIRTGDVGSTAWPILTALLLITGMQLFIFGLIMDMQSKTYRKTTKDKSYSVKSVEDF